MSAVKLIPIVDRDMFRFMQIGAIWPLETPSEKVELEELNGKGVDQKVHEYFEAKKAAGEDMTNLTGTEFAYYWNG